MRWSLIVPFVAAVALICEFGVDHVHICIWDTEKRFMHDPSLKLSFVFQEYMTCEY